MRAAASAALLAALAALAAPAATPPQAVGPLYPVAEPDLLGTIESAVRGLEGDGSMERMLDEAIYDARAYVNRPTPVPGIRRATRPSVRMLDPSVRVGRPVVAADGTVVHPAGTVVNPLEHVEMQGRLVLLDGDDPWQVELAGSLAAQGTPTKAVLVAGSPAAFEEATGARAYFDQNGQVSGRLRITEVPAVVSQQGLSLRVETLAPPPARPR